MWVSWYYSQVSRMLNRLKETEIEKGTCTEGRSIVIILMKHLRRMYRKLPGFSLRPEADETPVPRLLCVIDRRIAVWRLINKLDSYLCNHVMTQAGLNRSQGSAAAAENSCCFQAVIPLRWCRLSKRGCIFYGFSLAFHMWNFFCFLMNGIYWLLRCFIKGDCKEHTWRALPSSWKW